MTLAPDHQRCRRGASIQELLSAGVFFHDVGIEFETDEPDQYVTCKIHRKDRTHPTVVTEYMDECKRQTGPWGTHPRRMLRHKALVQCGRLAFGYAGIHDLDEAERIVDGISSAPAYEREPIKPVTRKADAPVEEAAPAADAEPMPEDLEAAL